MAVHGNTECVIPPAALTGNHEIQIQSSLYLCLIETKFHYVAPQPPIVIFLFSLLRAWITGVSHLA